VFCLHPAQSELVANQILTQLRFIHINDGNVLVITPYTLRVLDATPHIPSPSPPPTNLVQTSNHVKTKLGNFHE